MLVDVCVLAAVVEAVCVGEVVMAAVSDAAAVLV